MIRFQQQAAWRAGSPTSQSTAGDTAAAHLLPRGQFHASVRDGLAGANGGPERRHALKIRRSPLKAKKMTLVIKLCGITSLNCDCQLI